MNKYRLLSATALVLFAFTIIIGLYPANKVDAAIPVSGGGGSGDTFTFQDRGTIIGTITGVGQVTFLDSNVFDGTDVYVPQNSSFCNINLSGNFGITLNNPNFKDPIISGTLDVGQLKGQKCTELKEGISITNNNDVANAKYEWNGNNITTLPNQINSGTFTLGANSPNYYENSSPFTAYSDSTACAQSAILVDSSNTSGELYCFFKPVQRDGISALQNSQILNYQTIKNYYDTTQYAISGQYHVLIMGTPGSTPPGGGGGANGTPAGGAGANAPECESDGDPLDWILCPVFNGVADLSTWLFNNIVQPWLTTDPIDTSPADPTYQVWSSFRVYGDIFLVIALLVVVFGQSIGGGLIDAYTAKKVLPRLLIAAVLINLSIYIVAALVDISNIVGGSIGALLTGPFQANGAFVIHPSGIQSIKILGLGGAALTAGIGTGIIGLIAGAQAIGSALAFLALFVIMPMFFGALAAFVTLVIRKGIIIFLVLISPVAFALYCLPNTEQYFRRWWRLLLEMLLIYPIVIIFFAVADILSVTINQSNPNGGLAAIVVFVLQFIPLMFIPYAFRLAGGTLSRAHDAITTGHKRVQEGIKGNPNDPNSFRNRTKRNMGSAMARQQQAQINRGDDIGARRHRRIIGGLTGSGAFGNVDMKMAKYNKEMSDIEELMSSTGNDELRYAAGGYVVRKGENAFDGSTADHDRFFDSNSQEISANRYRRGKSYLGSNIHGVGSAIEYKFRKAQTAEDLAQARFAFKKNAEAGNWSDSELVGTWAQATIPHKDKWLSEWNSTPYRDTDGSVKFHDISNDPTRLDKAVNEIHSTREQFRQSGIRAQDWHALHEDMQQTESMLTAVEGGGTAPADYNERIRRYAKESEIVDSLAQPGVGTMSDNGEVRVSGASTEVQGVITAMTKGRKYGVSNAIDPASGEISTQHRAIYNRATATKPVLDSTGTQVHDVTGAPMTQDLRGSELDNHLRGLYSGGGFVAEAKDVSPDREAIKDVNNK